MTTLITCCANDHLKVAVVPTLDDNNDGFIQDINESLEHFKHDPFEGHEDLFEPEFVEKMRDLYKRVAKSGKDLIKELENDTESGEDLIKEFENDTETENQGQ